MTLSAYLGNKLRTHAFYVLALFAIAAAPHAFAAPPPYDGLDLGPKIGAKIPHNLAAQDQNGKQQNFHSLKGKKGLVLLFSRSVSWCPFCKGQAVDWNKRLGVAKRLGYKIAMVTYDPIVKSARFSRRQNIQYPILSDPKSKIIRAFGVFNKTHQPGSFAYGIPHPIIFVVDTTGKIKHRFSEATYSSRPNIGVVFKTLQRK